MFYNFRTGIVIRINGTNVGEVRCNVAWCIFESFFFVTLKVSSSIRRECNGEEKNWQGASTKAKRSTDAWKSTSTGSYKHVRAVNCFYSFEIPIYPICVVATLVIDYLWNSSSKFSVTSTNVNEREARAGIPRNPVRRCIHPDCRSNQTCHVSRSSTSIGYTAPKTKLLKKSTAKSELR